MLFLGIQTGIVRQGGIVMDDKIRDDNTSAWFNGHVLDHCGGRSESLV